MKKAYSLFMFFAVALVFTSCSSDDDATNDTAMFDYQNYTKSMFLGEWEGYAEKEITVSPMATISINEGAINNPWETMECYRMDLTFTNNEVTEIGNEWSQEENRHLCNVQVSFTDNWIYEDGENNFIQYLRNENDTIDEYIIYVHFMDNGDLVTWTGSYHGTKDATFFKKK